MTVDNPIIPLLPYQRAAVECTHPYGWWCWSRQSGKSFTLSLRRLIRGIKRRRRQIFMSAGERQSIELMEKVRTHLKALQIASSEESILHESGVKTLEVVIPGLTRITAIPANPDTARGFTGDILLDEYALHQKDKEIWAALLPTITRGGGEIDIASTPKGPLNQFAKLQSNEMFHHSLVTIYDAVDQGLDVDIKALKKLCDDPDIWAQEFECRFIDGANVFLKHEDILACMVDSLPLTQSPLALKGVECDLYGGYDVGRRHDFSVLWVVSKRENRFRTECVLELERVPFATQKGILESWLKLPRFRQLCIDETGIGMNLAEDLTAKYGRYRVEPIYFTQMTKNQLGSTVKVAIEAGELEMPHSEVILEDFHHVQKVVTAQGNIQLVSPRLPSGHSDRFWAASLALKGVKSGHGEPIAIGHSTHGPGGAPTTASSRRIA